MQRMLATVFDEAGKSGKLEKDENINEKKGGGGLMPSPFFGNRISGN